MTSRGWWVLMGVGVALMAAASVWAPPQPELIAGGSCNVAPCGTLEDPGRWRNAWLLWLAGTALALPATALGVRPSRVPRWPVFLTGVVVVSALVVTVALAAMAASLVTSVHGAATTAVVCVILPAVAAVSSWVSRRWSSGRRTSPSAPGARPRRPRGVGRRRRRSCR